MPADLHARAKEIFLKAIQLPPADRTSFVDETCVDNLALRQEVRDLLAHHRSETILPQATRIEESSVLRRGLQRLAMLEPDSAGEPVVLVAKKTPELADETSELLRQRLRGVTLVLTVALSLIYVDDLIEWDVKLISTRAVVWFIVAGSCGLLYSHRALSLYWLRVVDLVVLFAVGAQLVLVESAMLQRAADSGDEARTVAAVIINFFSWSMVILIYGGFMPNTWQRAAAILVPAACIPYLLTLLYSWHYKLVAELMNAGYVHMPLPMPLVAAFAAVYLAHIIHSVRRDAFEARQFGQYRLKAKLGAGGMGEVYEAEHVLLKRPCAIKLIRPELVASSQMLARFEREVKATASLSHWNTVEIYDYGQTSDGTFYYVMELLDGINLGEIVQRHGPLPPARAVHFLRQTCDALGEAHAAGLVHRDIKPANIFAARVGGIYDVAKLLDFGLVRETDAAHDPHLTSHGMILGTSLFMAPEQALASRHATAMSDIYSLGAVAYFLVTGQPPFAGDDLARILAAHAEDAVTPPADIRSEVPDDLNLIILKCLAKEPEQRFATAGRLEQALAACGCADQWSDSEAADWWHEHGGTLSRTADGETRGD